MLTCLERPHLPAVSSGKPLVGRSSQAVFSDAKLFIWLYFHSDSWFSVGCVMGFFFFPIVW